MEMGNHNMAKAKDTTKPPTRLQACAPASLELNQMGFSVASSSSANSLPADRAIPLLSPLVLSPTPLPEITEKSVHRYDHQQQLDGITAGKINSRGSLESGWQHPAVSTFNDPSAMFSLFQSQCTIVNPAP